MKLSERISSLDALGNEIRHFLKNPEAETSADWNTALKLAERENGWFTRENILKALVGIEHWLTKSALEKWISHYPALPTENKNPITISVVMAGNIPLVGFHDLLCVLISGNNIQAKLSSSDSVLLKLLVKKLVALNAKWEKQIKLVDKLSSTANAVIATGSNNTATHFEYYFRNTPHIIRRNRNGIAILDDNETEAELGKLGEDIFSYFGLGCRNISKLYVPEAYDLATFFRAIEKYSNVINHNKYANNYTYNRTIFLMDGKVFTDNNFLAVIENPQFSSPIAVLHFERYSDITALSKELPKHKEQIQCIAASQLVAKKLGNINIPVVELGQTQSPGLMDYADGVDVIKFILNTTPNP